MLNGLTTDSERIHVSAPLYGPARSMSDTRAFDRPHSASSSRVVSDDTLRASSVRKSVGTLSAPPPGPQISRCARWSRGSSGRTHDLYARTNWIDRTVQFVSSDDPHSGTEGREGEERGRLTLGG